MYNNLIINPLKIYLCKICITSFIAPTILFASSFEYKINKIGAEEFFLEVYKNDVLYEKYDSPISQFDKFFGLRINYDSDDQTNFNDLSITVDSKNIRNLYLRKLESLSNENENTTNEFYTEKL